LAGQSTLDVQRVMVLCDKKKPLYARGAERKKTPIFRLVSFGERLEKFTLNG